jgi:hypothetical protein
MSSSGLHAKADDAWRHQDGVDLGVDEALKQHLVRGLRAEPVVVAWVVVFTPS